MSAYTYDASKNPDGVWIDGVPLRDLTADEFKALKPHYQAAVKEQPFYVAVKASDKKASKKEEAK